MKYITLLLILCSSAFASELVEKAQAIESILNSAEKIEIISAFESATIIGTSIEALRQTGNYEEIEKNYQDAVIELIQTEAGTAAIDTFSLEELSVLQKLAAGTKEERSIAIKSICLATSQKPQMMQKASRIMMNYSKAVVAQRTNKSE